VALSIGAAMFFVILGTAGSTTGSRPYSPDESSWSSLWLMGFGKTHESTMISGFSRDLIVLILVANAPQVILSICYFCLNDVVTCMLAAKEYNDYALERKPLRVSWPKGQQRSTYHLSLPYWYSLPIMLVSAIMHWLLSQTLFFVQIDIIDIDGSWRSDPIMACGYSALPMLPGFILAGVIPIVALGLGIRRYKSNMPLAGNCSAALSAHCHPPSDDVDAALKHVIWGRIKDIQQGRRYQGSGDDSGDRMGFVVRSVVKTTGREDECIGQRQTQQSHAHYTFTSKEVMKTDIDVCGWISEGPFPENVH
jgi:hypothetical protein